jgi:uncharacterized protein with HEPN domain
MRSDELYLHDIVEAADAISSFIAGMDQRSFAASDLHLNAVQMKLIIIGEAVSRIAKEIKDRNTGIPWSKVAAYRNFAAHAYFAVSARIVWETAIIHAPAIRLEVLKIIAAEFPA